MNSERRKEIAKAQRLIGEAQAIIAQCASEERDYYDNMPGSLQSSAKGEQAEEHATTLEEMDEALDELANKEFSE